MPNEINALIVILDRGYSEQEILPLVEALRQFKKVTEVKPNAAGISAVIAKSVALNEIRAKVLEVFAE